jgi:hypothetical protein
MNTFSKQLAAGAASLAQFVGYPSSAGAAAVAAELILSGS